LYLKTVVNLPTTPGSCNTNGVNVCGFGLTQ
jgi:hypothetical protein